MMVCSTDVDANVLVGELLLPKVWLLSYKSTGISRFLYQVREASRNLATPGTLHKGDDEQVNIGIKSVTPQGGILWFF